jgi:serine/threonine-protein kinase
VWRPSILVPALLALVVLAAGVVFVGIKLSERSDTTSPPAPAPGPAPNAGPFTGVYRADFGPEVDLAGKPLDGGATTTGTYDIRSVCPPTGCVATANRKSSPTLQPMLVFDEVGQSWLSVAFTASMSPSSASLAPGFRKNCPHGVAVTGEIWEVFSLQPRANGTLAGEYTARSSNSCDTTRTVTFTRVGDVDVNSVPDPASQAPRVVSPAEALRGRYHYTITGRFATGGTVTAKGDYVVRTDCLRTGERCMSFLHDDKDGDPLVFADGAWTENGEHDGSCSSGGSYRVKASGTFPLPQPLQDPIPLLTGNGRAERSPGTACISFDFDVKYERTGD